MIDMHNEGKRRKQRNLERERKIWLGKKRKALVVAARLRVIGKFGRAYRMSTCADTVISDVCPKCETRHLVEVRFCRDRLCPLCVWRRSKMLAKRLGEIVTICEKVKPSRYVLMTLAVKNVPWENLSKEIPRIMYAWKKFQAKINRANVVTGWARSFEVNRSKIHGTAHPHIHILMQVPHQYFEQNSGIFLQHRQAELISQWRDCLGVDYDPTVDIRAVRSEGYNLGCAILETARYISKVESLEGLSDDEFYHYDEALHHVRAWSTGGRMKIPEEEIERELQGEQPTEEGACGHCGTALYEMREVWSADKLDYVLKIDFDYNNGKDAKEDQMSDRVDNKSDSEEQSGESRNLPTRTVNVNINNTGGGTIYVNMSTAECTEKQNRASVNPS